MKHLHIENVLLYEMCYHYYLLYSFFSIHIKLKGIDTSAIYDESYCPLIKKYINTHI